MSQNLTVFELSQKTLEILQKYNIPCEPKAYEVWFNYVSQDHVEVVKAIDEYIAKGGVPDIDFTNKLYSTVLSYDMIAKTVDSVTNMLNEQIVCVTGSMSETDDELGLFSDLLVGASNEIEEGMFTSDLAGKLNVAIDRVNNKIRELESDLENSQEEIKKLQNYLETVRQETNVDPLTSLATRRKYDQWLSQIVRNSIECDEEMCVAFFEVDHYEAFKTKWGQSTSEQILRFIGLALRENIKGRDVASRYASTIFALILPKTALEGAKVVSEHVREIVERKRIIKKTTGEFLGRVTLSIGIASYKKGESIGLLSARCEKALLAARANGRNCIVTELEADEILAGSDFPEAGVV